MVSTMSRKAAPVVAVTAVTMLFAHSASALAAGLPLKMRLQPRATYAGTAQGCFSSPGGSMQLGSSSIYQSSGKCGPVCASLNKPVMALQGDACLCGDLLPSSSSQLSLSACSTVCPGYDVEDCGGSRAYTVWLTGVDDSVGSSKSSDDSSEQASSSSVMLSTSSSIMPSSTADIPSKHTAHTRTNTYSQPTHRPSHHPKPQQSHKTRVTTTEKKTTVVKTKIVTNPTPNATQEEKSSSHSTTSSTIGIAVGVVGGIICFAAIIAGILFYLRRRRRLKNAENGHRRADSLNAFVAAGGHLPSSNFTTKIPAIVVNDARLDPRIMHENRRVSAGSFFADNEDYSRRILKVTNPDGT